MSQDPFELECDRLSEVVDPAQFERLRWDRNEGPMLARLVALAHSALEGRSEFELIEEGATSDIKRFVLKVHSHRVVAVAIRLADGQVHVTAEEIERSRYKLNGRDPISASFDAMDERWMADALQELFGRIAAN